MATFHPLDYLSLVRRRRWWIVVPAIACIVVASLLAVFLPRVYRSAATITVSSPAISAELLKQAGPLSREERIRAISQQLLSRAVLEQVVRDEHLALDGNVDAAVDRLLEPNRIKVEPTELLKQVARDGLQLDAFLLSYAGPTPGEAQRVADTIARVFVEASSRTREARAEDTSAFIATQLAASKDRLDRIEERLRKAKESYMGRLPEQTQSNLSIAAGMRQQLESTAIALRGEQDRLSMIERQIDGMKQGAGDVALSGRSMSGSEARVLQLQQELANARGMYTEKHPEIQRLQDDLAAAKRDAAAERARPEEERLDRLRMDPGYRQLLADRETARLRVRDLQRAESQMRAQVASYQSRVEAAPMVEQQLASLQREYDLEKQQYGDLSAKLQSADLAESLERRRGGEQFQVLYAAYVPREPEFPNVMRLLLLGVALGIGLGGASAVGREYLDRSVHDVRGLQAEFDVPVLGEISRISRAA
jgi:polysaccharide biosynthesis transport protein